MIGFQQLSVPVQGTRCLEVLSQPLQPTYTLSRRPLGGVIARGLVAKSLTRTEATNGATALALPNHNIQHP